MQPITITLDGREVSGYPGMTILELARESGIDIPTLCYDPRLASIGACRICLVEDERTGGVWASCVTPIAPGMVINTRSPRVIEHRTTIVKLMLASHPDSCLVCDKGNRCQLRQVASELGIGLLDLQKIPQIRWELTFPNTWRISLLASIWRLWRQFESEIPSPPSVVASVIIPVKGGAAAESWTSP